MSSRLLLIVAFALTLGYIGWRLSARASLRITNPLALPVRVQINADPLVVVAPGGRLERRLARGTTVVSWEAERARTRGGVPVGEPVRGTRIIERPSGDISHLVTPSRGDTALFAPLITNETGVPLLVRVNAGTAAAEECACRVPPGARRANVGYYRLFRNSSVEVRDSSGRRALFPDLGAEIRGPAGTVGLRFGAADLR